MCYGLSPGNTNDCLTLKPMIQKLQKDYSVDRVIVVADKELNTGKNIVYQKAIGNGYVMSLSIRGANQELKDFVLNEDGYTYNQDKTYKKKSRRYPREVKYIKNVNGKEVEAKITVDEKQVIFWSADYAKRAKAEHQPAIDKAKDLIGNVQKYNKKNCYGASKYVKHLVFDEQTGEIIKAKSKYLALVLSRVLQYKLDKKYSVGKILESLSKCNCQNLEENIYRFNYYDTVLKEIGEVIDVDFSLKK